MTLSDLINVAFVVGFVGFVGYEIQHGRRRDRMFRAVGEQLGVRDFVHTKGSMSGTVRGLPFSFAHVGSTKSTPEHTVIAVGCEPCALALYLRAQTGSEVRAVERREAVDVVLGDPVFDARWIVEGAPPERVRRVLADPALRARLVAFSELGEPHVSIEGGKVTLHRRGSEIGPDAIATERIELAIALAEAVVADARTPLGAGEIDPAASHYRAAVRVDPGAAQIRELHTMRAIRAVRQVRLVAVILHTFTTGMMLMVRAVFGLNGPTAVALLLFAIFGTAIVVSMYRSATKEAPDVQRDAFTVRWVLACWAVNLGLTAAAFAGG